MSGALLKVDGIETFYGSSQALFGMSFEVGQGEIGRASCRDRV